MKTAVLILLILVQCGLIVYAFRILGTMLFMILYHTQTLPFVPTMRKVTKMMVQNNYVKDGDTIVDLGCGTGTLCIAYACRFKKSHVVGVERESLLALTARVRSWRFSKRVEIIRGDMFAYQGLAQANVVAGFWITELMPQVVAKLTSECTSGTTIISHMFPLTEHPRIQLVEKIEQGKDLVRIYTIV